MYINNTYNTHDNNNQYIIIYRGKYPITDY